MFFINSFLYSQKKESTDSIAYYTNLANSSIKENKYKDALLLLRKQSIIATTTNRGPSNPNV
jgi:hypothetical protein